MHTSPHTPLDPKEWPILIGLMQFSDTLNLISLTLSICLNHLHCPSVPLKAPWQPCQVLLTPSQFPLKLLTWFSASSLRTHTGPNCRGRQYHENSNTVTIERQAVETGYSGQLNEFLTQRAPCKSCFNHSLYFSAQIAHLSNGDINSTYFTEDLNELIHVNTDTSP